MKKQFMIIGLALLTLGAVSCKKDYVCDCHIDYNDGTHHEDNEYPYENVSKDDAEEACDTQQGAYEAMPTVESVNCQLK